MVLLKPLLHSHLIILCTCSYEGDPLLPQWGKQSKGTIPLTASFSGVLFSIIRWYRNREAARSGGRERTMGKESPRTIDCVTESFNNAEIFIISFRNRYRTNASHFFRVKEIFPNLPDHFSCPILSRSCFVCDPFQYNLPH